MSMTQPAMPLPLPPPMANGTPGPLSSEGASGKRKRDADDEAMDVDVNADVDVDADSDNIQKPAAATNGDAERAERQLIQSFFQVLSSFDIQPPILKRPLSEHSSEDEPDAKRQKSTDLAATSTIAAKVAANAYEHLDDLEEDLVSAVQSAVDELKTSTSLQDSVQVAEQLAAFKTKALKLVRQEKAYPRTSPEPAPTEADAAKKPEMVLSLIGYAPQEKRLFSSLPVSHDLDLTELNLPQGVTLTQVMPSTHQDRTQTLGELFSSPRTLPPLQPPKQPKTQAKGNTLDFYRPELTDQSKYRSNTYFTTKLTAGHYLDYSNATPSSQIQTKQRERAQSLAGKKPSTVELEMTEMESLFRGAFSSFAPCKDDTAAIVPSSVAGRMWWQRTGQRQFQNMIEVEFYGGVDSDGKVDDANKAVELDEAAIQDAIDNWDEALIDPSLEEIMGSNKKKEEEKEIDEILDEVSDMIETLSSYQRIRNLSLPSSQNRQSSDPVTGDMLATAGPQPSEEEQATYQMLKAQLALVIKTLPPYAVAKLNGDQLEDLLISTKVQVQTDQYRGVMEEDDAALQARLRAQQAAHVSARPVQQRTPSMPPVSFAPQYQPPQQYGTPARPGPQQYYRPGVTPSYQPPQRPVPPSQPRLPQPNQYTRPNGYQNQFATQLAKAQTPYGHQNMPQFAGQQRPQYGQLPPQQATPTRFSYQPTFPPQQPSTPSQGAYGTYTNGAGMPPRNMSPQVQQHRQSYSPSPNMQQAQRYGTPGQSMGGQMSRYPSGPGQPVPPPPPPPPNPNPGLTGYHTVIPEAQQQRIMEQAKARAAAHERSAMFGDKMTQPNVAHPPPPPPAAAMNMANTLNASQLAAIRAGMAAQQQQKALTPGLGQRPGLNGTPGGPHIPHKVTPVPVPPIPGLPQQRQPST